MKQIRMSTKMFAVCLASDKKTWRHFRLLDDSKAVNWREITAMFKEHYDLIFFGTRDEKALLSRRKKPIVIEDLTPEQLEICK